VDRLPAAALQTPIWLSRLDCFMRQPGQSEGDMMSEHSQLWRAPLQGGGRWQYEGRVRIGHGTWVGRGSDGLQRSGLTVSGAIASGRGNSKVVAQIGPEDFAALAQAMCVVNREAAILAFSKAILEFIGPESTTPDIEPPEAR